MTAPRHAILIVERNPKAAAKLAAIFEDLRWDHATAHDAASAFKMMSIMCFDIALVDAALDDNAASVGRALRRLAGKRHLRVVALGDDGAPVPPGFDAMVPRAAPVSRLVATAAGEEPAAAEAHP